MFTLSNSCWKPSSLTEDSPFKESLLCSVHVSFFWISHCLRSPGEGCALSWSHSPGAETGPLYLHQAVLLIFCRFLGRQHLGNPWYLIELQILILVSPWEKQPSSRNFYLPNLQEIGSYTPAHTYTLALSHNVSSFPFPWVFTIFPEAITLMTFLNHGLVLSALKFV